MTTRVAASSHDIVMAESLNPGLRTMTDRIERLYALLQRRMLTRQTPWGHGETILDDPEVAEEPLMVRKALAFWATLMGMPIEIEKGDLIVGNTVQDGNIVRAVLPQYATPEELDAAKKEGQLLGYALAHKTPAYDELMKKGLMGIMGDVDAKVAEIEA